MKYSLLKGVLKALIPLVVFGIPFLTTTFPDVANLTLGTLGVLIVNYVKIKSKMAGFLK